MELKKHVEAEPFLYAMAVPIIENQFRIILIELNEQMK